jgi:hypothetical protein
LETTADNAHVVISGIPVKLQRVRFLVLEQLLSDLEDGIPENSLVKTTLSLSLWLKA